MPAYVIVDVTINNSEAYSAYKELTPVSIKNYNGKFIVRGGLTQTLEGDWKPERIVVLEFPDVDTARAWWNSDEYAGAKKIRQANAETRMILVEGFSA